MEIAAGFFDFGVLGTRRWIKDQNPSYSELEVTLAFVEMSYREGRMLEWQWEHFRNFMQVKIRRDWAERFRAIMKAKGLNYEQVAQLAGFKNGNVVKATVSRGLPHFARLMVVLWEAEWNEADSATTSTCHSAEPTHTPPPTSRSTPPSNPADRR